MEMLLRVWKASFYTWPAAFLATFIFSILFFIPANRSRNIPLAIKWYLIAYGFTFIITDGIILFRNKYDDFTNKINNYTDYCFTVTEFILITYYFYINNRSARYKKILLYLTALFLIAIIVFALQLPREIAVVRLYTTQVFLLLIPSFFYFRKLFKSPTTTDISNAPSFWISTGITFFLLYTMSLSIIETFFLNHKPHILAKLYPIYYIFYILMFIMFFRAYLCKPVTIKS